MLTKICQLVLLIIIFLVPNIVKCASIYQINSERKVIYLKLTPDEYNALKDGSSPVYLFNIQKGFLGLVKDIDQDHILLEVQDTSHIGLSEQFTLVKTSLNSLNRSYYRAQNAFEIGIITFYNALETLYQSQYNQNDRASTTKNRLGVDLPVTYLRELKEHLYLGAGITFQYLPNTYFDTYRGSVLTSISSEFLQKNRFSTLISLQIELESDLDQKHSNDITLNNSKSSAGYIGTNLGCRFYSDNARYATLGGGFEVRITKNPGNVIAYSKNGAQFDRFESHPSSRPLAFINYAFIF